MATTGEPRRGETRRQAEIDGSCASLLGQWRDDRPGTSEAAWPKTPPSHVFAMRCGADRHAWYIGSAGGP